MPRPRSRRRMSVLKAGLRLRGATSVRGSDEASSVQSIPVYSELSNHLTTYPAAMTKELRSPTIRSQDGNEPANVGQLCHDGVMEITRSARPIRRPGEHCPW